MGPVGLIKTLLGETMLDDLKSRIDTLVERMTDLRGYL